MAWYRTGTVTVTNGSATVTGAGTDFVSNSYAGDGLRGPDGRLYEISRVVSATELTLAEGYNGATAGGQPFAIQPTQSYTRDLAQAAAALLATFGAVRDGVGQGIFGDGSTATPGIRFALDQDTGLRRYGENAFSLVSGGTDRLLVHSAGAELRGQWGVTGGCYVYAGQPTRFCNTLNSNWGTIQCVSTDAGAALSITDGSGTGLRLDGTGNVLVGMASGASHRIRKPVAEGQVIAVVDASDNGYSAVFVGVTLGGAGDARAALLLGRHSVSGRSLNAGGTINASGADYAEYMTKAAECGTIAAGEVCGVDADGKLTRTWTDARSFVVKSTDPAYVGGDTWAAGMPARPEAPGAEPIEPAALPTRPAQDDPELDAWRELADAYPATIAAWRAAHSAWAAASATYDRELPAWEAELEAERVKVDRIAFCGQVPVNVTGDFAVGDYLIAAPVGAGIKAVAVTETAITFEQYRRRLGKVWAVRDGRAWVDVQHG